MLESGAASLASAMAIEPILNCGIVSTSFNLNVVVTETELQFSPLPAQPIAGLGPRTP